MTRLRAFIRWMMVDASRPELAQAQFHELKSQIPALYALLMVNALAVSYTHYDFAPLGLTVGVLVPMLLVTTTRMLSWIRLGKTTLEPEAAIKKMRKTVLLASLVSAVYIAWSLSLDQYGGPAERGHVALFIAITVIGCIFCLINLPQAAIMVMAIVSLPYMVYYLAQGEAVYVAIAMNIFLVCLVVLKVLLNGYRGFTALVETQQETERLSAENARLAQTDALTDLPNRRYFFRSLEARIGQARIANRSFAVGVVDLDRFKPINDTYGHQLGDQLLMAVGDRLKAVSGADLDICRLGGDEFGFIFYNATDKVGELAHRLCDRIREPFEIGELTLTVGASCGIALYPEAGRSAHELFDRADYALYTSKATSRGSVTIYSAAHEARACSERAIESALQSCNMETEFQVYFQPIVSLPSRKIVGFEALARWQNPTLGPVSPADFIPLAERTGLICKLTTSLFAKAVAQISELPGQLCLSFNLSAHDITCPKTVMRLIETARLAGVSPQQVMFELTETAVIGSYEAAEAGLKSLRAAGFKLALDDFGTGYSSLGYLHRLPLDCVKVDRSFVADMHDPVAGGVITSILDLCRSMDLLCVVEGIEREEQARMLEDLNCRFAQGYHFSYPMTFEAVTTAIAEDGLVSGLELDDCGPAGVLPRRAAVNG